MYCLHADLLSPCENFQKNTSLSIRCDFVFVFLQQQKIVVDKRECCLQEIRQTEEKYSDTLESILQVCTSSVWWFMLLHTFHVNRRHTQAANSHLKRVTSLPSLLRSTL